MDPSGNMFVLTKGKETGKRRQRLTIELYYIAILYTIQLYFNSGFTTAMIY